MKKKKSLILASVLGVAFAIGGAFLIPKQVDVSADWSAIQLESTYTIGESITIEPRTINVGGQNYNATSIVKLPDGTATKLTEIKLDESGLYTVVYTATVNGTHYYTEFTFTVMDEIIRIKSDNLQTESSLEYGLHSTATTRPGMMVSLAEGDSVTFAPIIDLTNSKMEDWFVELYITSSAVGEYDFEEIEVTLTDVENPESTLTITGRRSVENTGAMYCLAAGDGQPLSGYEPSWNRLHVENEWGNPFDHSFTSTYGSKQQSDYKTIKFSYDSTTKVVYATDGAKTEMIIDLDNPEHFGDQLWGGFQSGKVQLSIKGDMYTKNFATFTVVNVPGVDMEGGSMLDENAPVITVDTEYTDAPDAQVGYSYPVPDATANDDYAGDVSVKKAVWFNYTSANRLSIPIVDGRFDVTQVGTYYIVYTAEDMAGNVAEKVIVVDSLATLPDITLEVDASSMASWLVGSAYEAEAGDRIPLPAASTEGGSGNVEVTYWYELDGEDTLIESTQFRPISAGDYVLKVVATDYLGRTASEGYNFTVSAATGPIFDNDPILPKYLISGYEYTLDAFYADDYTSGEHEAVLTNISIIDNNGERTLGADRKVTPVSANNGDKVTLKYTVPGTSSVYTTEVICIHKDGPFTLPNGQVQNRLQMQNYFYPYGVEVSKPSGSVVRILKDDANGYWEFANRLGADGLNFTFNAVPSSSKFDGLKVTLQDSIDETNEIAFTIYNQSGNAYMIDETNSRVALSCGFDANAMSNQFSVSYKGGRAYVGTASMEITKKPDGTKFTGFDSGYVYLSVEFVNASDSDCYDITSVNGHVISGLAYDAAGPAISIVGDYGDGVGKGEWVTLPSAIASDTIDPSVTCTLTVKDPNGNVVYGYLGQTAIALNGVDPSETYTFQPSMYGAYTVTFSSKDSRQTSTASYNVNVEDRTAPSITFKAQFQTQITLGETIVVPKFTVADDEAMKRVDVYVTTNGGIVYTLHSSTSTSGELGGYGFKPIYKGEYIVRVVVTDNNYNQTVVLKRIQVA